MLKFILKATLFISFIIPLAVVAQVNENQLSNPPEQLTTEYKEKELVLDAFAMFNGDQVEKSYVTAHKLRKTLKTEYGLSNANLLLAYYFQNKTLIDSSLYYVNQSLKYKEVGTDSMKTRGRSLAYNILAINYKNKGLLTESKKWHLKGIEEAEKYNEENLYYTHTHGLGLTYSTMGNYTRALELFKECLKYEDDEEIVYGSYINIGSLYAEMEDYESSEKIFKQRT